MLVVVVVGRLIAAMVAHLQRLWPVAKYIAGPTIPLQGSTGPVLVIAIMVLVNLKI
jgi:hypothetical protein